MLFSVPKLVPTLTSVDTEATRRLAAGFTFAGVIYQADMRSQSAINLNFLSALTAVTNGAQLGDLRWMDPTKDFAWTAADNSQNTMDAFTMVQFGQACTMFVSLIQQSSRAIKNLIAAGSPPGDITANSLWQ